MKRYCFALDLINDEQSIAEYEMYHRNVWPEVLVSIKESGIRQLDIYRTGNRLFMMMETIDNFSLEEKALADQANAKVQAWETLMWKYQQSLPLAKPGEKWVLMEKLFTL